MGPASSGTVEIHSHAPSRFCFHRDTSLSPDDTARTFPVIDQETRHTGAGKVFISAADHGPEGCDCVQMTTPLSSEQLATMLHGIPVAGAQATSRTQSECRGDESCELPSSCHSVSPSAHLLTCVNILRVGFWYCCETRYG